MIEQGDGEELMALVELADKLINLINLLGDALVEAFGISAGHYPAGLELTFEHLDAGRDKLALGVGADFQLNECSMGFGCSFFAVVQDSDNYLIHTIISGIFFFGRWYLFGIFFANKTV